MIVTLVTHKYILIISKVLRQISVVSRYGFVMTSALNLGYREKKTAKYLEIGPRSGPDIYMYSCTYTVNYRIKVPLDEHSCVFL